MKRPIVALATTVASTLSALSLWARVGARRVRGLQARCSLLERELAAERAQRCALEDRLARFICEHRSS